MRVLGKPARRRIDKTELTSNLRKTRAPRRLTWVIIDKLLYDRCNLCKSALFATNREHLEPKYTIHAFRLRGHAKNPRLLRMHFCTPEISIENRTHGLSRASDPSEKQILSVFAKLSMYLDGSIETDTVANFRRVKYVGSECAREIVWIIDPAGNFQDFLDLRLTLTQLVVRQHFYNYITQ